MPCIPFVTLCDVYCEVRHSIGHLQQNTSVLRMSEIGRMISCHAQLNALPFDAQKHMKVVLRIFLLLYAIVHLDLHALN